MNSFHIADIEEPPSKCVSQTVTVRVTAQVLFIDFEGRSDGESIRKIVEVRHLRLTVLSRHIQRHFLALGVCLGVLFLPCFLCSILVFLLVCVISLFSFPFLFFLLSVSSFHLWFSSCYLSCNSSS